MEDLLSKIEQLKMKQFKGVLDFSPNRTKADMITLYETISDIIT